MNEKEIKDLGRWCGGVSRDFHFTAAAVERQFELPCASSSLCPVTKGNPRPGEP
jgi:hypothetical protein